MLDQILPRHVGNDYRGHKLALWLLALLALMKVAMGLNSIFNGRVVASSADGVPLDTFSPAGAQAVVALFAIWGLGQLILGSACILALVRYRAMVPFTFALLLLEQISRKLILHFLPIPTSGSSPGHYVNLVFLLLMIVGLALSLRRRAGPGTRG